MGIDTRTTMDMDTCVKGIDLTDAELYEILNDYARRERRFGKVKS